MEIDSQDEDMEYTYEEDGEEYGEEEEDDGDDGGFKESEINNHDKDDKWNYSEGSSYMKADIDMTSGEDSLASLPAATGPSSADKTAHGSGKKRSKIHDGDGFKSQFMVPDDGYVIKECTAVEPLMSSLISEVSSLLDLNVAMTQSLLQASKWDKEKLIDNFFGNPDKTLQQCGLDLYPAALLHHLPGVPVDAGKDSSSANRTFQCRICFNPTIDYTQAFALGCGHLFCIDCYSEYAKNQLSDGRSCVMARCPEFKCNQTITTTVFNALLTDKDDKDKYNLYHIRNFIEISKNMKYCPAPRCDKVAIGSGVGTVRCSCSYPFCFRCGEEAHEPTSCAQLAEWTQKCSNESETANWILANTRKCPNCSTRIEKNQGCNHMTCRFCKHEFCWTCMGNWSDHGSTTGGFYKCNRFDTSATSPGLNQQLTAAQRAKAELDRYLHYYQRYHGHSSALKFANAQRELAEKRMVESQESQRKSSWIDVQFMKQAAEQVIDCRRVLKFTYVLGYFLTDNSPEKQLFEHHQEMLEKNTEKLHEYTEKTIDQVDRTHVVNLTRITEKFMTSLLASMTGGVVTMLDEGVNSSSSSSSSSGAGAAGKALKGLAVPAAAPKASKGKSPKK